ncbi:hypothetical protein MRX96_006902 [Rhipicephalus microplus]
MRERRRSELPVSPLVVRVRGRPAKWLSASRQRRVAKVAACLPPNCQRPSSANELQKGLRASIVMNGPQTALTPA